MAKIKKEKKLTEKSVPQKSKVVSTSTTEVLSEEESKSSVFKDLYSKSAFADESKRSSVIASFVVLIIFILFIAGLFSTYTFGANIPGFSNLIDRIPVLKSLDRSPQNILPKTFAADQGINSYNYNVDFALQSSGASGGSITQQFSGNINFKNPKNVLSSSTIFEKFSSASSSSTSSLVIDGKFIQNSNKFFINFSKFPSALNSGIKTNKWILLPNLEFSFLSKLDNQPNINYSNLDAYSLGNSVVNGTVVTHYVVIFPKSDFSKLNLLTLMKSVFGNSTVTSKSIRLDEWVGVADNKVYQESISFNASVSGAPAKVYFEANMTSFNTNFTVNTPSSYTNLQGKTVSSKKK